MKNIEPGRRVHFFTGLEHTLLRQFLARDGIHAHEDAGLPPGETEDEDWGAYLDVPRWEGAAARGRIAVLISDMSRAPRCLGG